MHGMQLVLEQQVVMVAVAEYQQGFQLSSVTSSSATVSWSAVTGAVSYNLQYKTSAASLTQQ